MTTVNEMLFFDSKPDALALYEAFREAVLAKVPDARIEVKKTQISFFDRRMFAAVSFAPVRKAKDRPKSFLTITFGLAYRNYIWAGIQEGIRQDRCGSGSLSQSVDAPCDDRECGRSRRGAAFMDCGSGRICEEHEAVAEPR